MAIQTEGGVAGSTSGPTTGSGDGTGAQKQPKTAADWGRLIHRSLRGRYRLTVLLVLLGGGIGASIAWQLAGPTFRSEGMVRIPQAAPSVIKENDPSKNIAMFDSFMQAQQEMVTSRAVLESAMQDDAWRTVPITEKRPTIEEMALRLKAEVRPRSENIRISYADQSAAMASAAVLSTVHAYQQAYDNDRGQVEKQRLQLLEEYRDKLKAQLDAAMPPPPVVTPPTTQVAEKSATTRPADEEEQFPPAPAAPERPTAEKLAMVDTTMRKLLDDRDKAQTDLDQAKMIYGPSHRQIARLELNLQAAADKVDQYLDEYIDLHTPRPVVARTSTTQPSQAIAMAAPIAPPAPPAPPPLSPALQQVKNELDDMNRRIEVMKTEAAMPKRLEIVSIGEFPVAVQDRRIKMSAASGVGAGFLPLGLMILAGLLRRSYAYCAEITEDFSMRTPFVAAIPDVDVDDDVQLSDDASQCVHHLREAIRQNAHTFLITSPGQGDGRTSLVISLALSMCASGSRTVIIDADIVSRGISKNLGLENAPGFYDALVTCDVGSFVRLSRSGVAIVPSGQARKSDAMAISAASLGKIIQQLRETFDVVLIDSGPLLPRVETTVIARQVDGVLLAIGRGQKQAVARDAIVKLGQLKANVLGTVFNRAEVEDFYRSIQHGGFVSATTSSGPRDVSETLESFGPLVRSVALSLRKEVEVLSDSDPAAVRLRTASGAVAPAAQTRAA